MAIGRMFICFPIHCSDLKDDPRGDYMATSGNSLATLLFLCLSSTAVLVSSQISQ